MRSEPALVRPKLLSPKFGAQSHLSRLYMEEISYREVGIRHYWVTWVLAGLTFRRQCPFGQKWIAELTHILGFHVKSMTMRGLSEPHDSCIVLHVELPGSYRDTFLGHD